jgi:beta-lactamase regulating signal transducer with metallopeptidase domain
MDAVTRWLAGGLLTASVQGAVGILLIWGMSRAIPKVPATVQAALWWVAALKLLVALLPIPALSLPILPAEIASPVLTSSRAPTDATTAG